MDEVLREQGGEELLAAGGAGPADRDPLARRGQRRRRGAGGARARPRRRASRASWCARSPPGSSWSTSPRRCTASAGGASTSSRTATGRSPAASRMRCRELKAAGLTPRGGAGAAGAAVDRAGAAGASDGVDPAHDPAPPAAHGQRCCSSATTPRWRRTSGARCSSASAPRSAPTGRPRSIRASA